MSDCNSSGHFTLNNNKGKYPHRVVTSNYHWPNSAQISLLNDAGKVYQQVGLEIIPPPQAFEWAILFI